MPKVQLNDGRSATMVYRGDTEEERTENAVQYRFLQEIIGRLRARGDLTEETARVLGICIEDRVEIIPDKEPQQAPEEKQVTETTTVDAAGLTTRRRSIR